MSSTDSQESDTSTSETFTTTTTSHTKKSNTTTIYTSTDGSGVTSRSGNGNINETQVSERVVPHQQTPPAPHIQNRIRTEGNWTFNETIITEIRYSDRVKSDGTVQIFEVRTQKRTATKTLNRNYK